MTFFYLFIGVTILVVLLTEKLEALVLSRYFRGFLDEVERVEAEIREYYALSLLAIVMNDREAYEGFQKMANEKYWPIFFRKMMFTTSLFFLLLSPYMLFTTFFFSSEAFSYIMFIAIAFFTAKLGFNFLVENINVWRDAKKAEKYVGDINRED